jgi:hypothetical protein
MLRNRRYRLVRRPSPRSKMRAMARWLALIAITQQVSCSGGGGAGAPSNGGSDTPTPVTVSISPSSAQIAAGASVDFIATVQNAANLAVSWQVNGLPGGNSTLGTMTPSGAGTATYMAPANVSAPLMVTVSAVSQADPTKAGSAIVTIQPLPGAQVSVSPANPDIVAGGSLQFSATVQNGAQAVIWEVDNIPGGATKFGTISSSGFYTAPAQIPNPPIVAITAVLETDLSIAGSTSVTIIPPAVTVSVSPSTANVVIGQTQQFSATVQNSNSGITWEVNGVPGGNPALGFGTINLSGLYTAPVTVPNPATVSVTAVLQTNPPISASAGATVVLPSELTGVYSWRSYNGADNSLTGQNAQEIVLTPTSVSSTTGATFGKLFRCAVDPDDAILSQIFAQPLYVSNVAIPNLGTHNVVYVATEHDSVYAFDADSSSCQVLWHDSFIDPTMNVTTVPATDITGQTDIVPEIGITGTPAIDASTATLYVVSKTKVNQGATPSYIQELHALDLATGAEKFNGPAIIHAIVSGTGDGSLSGEISFNPLTENQRSALLFSGGKIYVGFDSYDDTDPFHGWLFAYNASDLQSPPSVFNSTPNGSRGGIGESGAAPSSGSSGDVFVVTSDGMAGVPGTITDYPQTLLKLQVSSTPLVVDSFMPPNEVSLEAQLKSFGSTGVLLLPNTRGSAVPLAIVGSDALSGVASSPDLYVLNSGNLGLMQSLCLTSNGSSNAPASIFGTPAYWAGNNTIYVAAASDSVKAFPLMNGVPISPVCPTPAAPAFESVHTFDVFAGSFGASPVVSWDGNNAISGVVWALDSSGYTGNANTSSPAILHAYNATNLEELYVSPSSTSDPAAGPAVKFAVPVVANGKVYIGTQGELSVFGLQ